MATKVSVRPVEVPLESEAIVTASTGYQVRLSRAAEDPEWDHFVARTPGGHHVQTALWGQVKAWLGWRAARVVVTQGGRVVAGAQLLVRPLPVTAAFGYVPKGPLLAIDDAALTEIVVRGLHRLARAHGVQYLVTQPPDNSESLASRLPTMGFRPSVLEVAPTATVLVDLARGEDEILASMKPKTRYNIHLGARKGVTVREGTGEDLVAFYRLLAAFCSHMGFSLPPEGYFSHMSSTLGPHGHFKVLVAERESELLSALLLVPFGDTVIYKRGAWSVGHGHFHPNETVLWGAMRWARSHGYRYFDFEGIDPDIARALLRGAPLSELAASGADTTMARFKLGFGGRVAVSPGAYDYVYNPPLRWVYHKVYPKVAGWRVLGKMQDAVRGLAGGGRRIG